MFKREGFGRGSDQNPEAVNHAVSEPGVEGFAQHPFESAGDLLEGHDPENSFPVAVQQWPSVSNPSELSLQPRFRSARDQLRLYLSGMRWQHMQGRYFLLDTSGLPGSWTLVTLQALLDESRALLKHVTGG